MYLSVLIYYRRAYSEKISFTMLWQNPLETYPVVGRGKRFSVSVIVASMANVSSSD